MTPDPFPSELRARVNVKPAEPYGWQWAAHHANGSTMSQATTEAEAIRRGLSCCYGHGHRSARVTTPELSYVEATRA